MTHSVAFVDCSNVNESSAAASLVGASFEPNPRHEFTNLMNPAVPLPTHGSILENVSFGVTAAATLVASNVFFDTGAGADVPPVSTTSSMGGFTPLTLPGSTGASRAALKSQTTYVGWDFASTWQMDPTSGYPIPKALLTP